MIWKVTEKLFWGDMDTPNEIKQRGIGSLICVAEELPMPVVEVPFLKMPILNGHPVPSSVQPMLISVLIWFIEFYPPAAIYCRGGSNRSVGIVFLYLTDICKMTREDAWNRIKLLKENALDWSEDYTKIKEAGE